MSLFHKHERRLSTLLFVTGFVVDLITYLILDLAVVNLLFLGYLALLVVLIFATHVYHRYTESPLWWKQAIAVLAPLFTQFTLGSLFSGLLIFYTKSAALAVSWPFILLLTVVFFGNEVFRTYRSHLIFQTLLFFFGLYLYLIFAVPLFLEELGPMVFLISTGLTVLVFTVFLFVLWLVSRENLKKTIREIATGAAGMLALIVSCYFTGIIPPLPLALKESGIYHTVSRVGDTYEVSFENEYHWWEWNHTMSHQPGTPLYAYSAIYAPGSLTTSVAHRWLRYDEARDAWVNESLVAFPVSGGREGGYRGYSMKANPSPGKWIVRIETLEGQVIGDITFTVENTNAAPQLRTETR
jgi:hypothetical protein